MRNWYKHTAVCWSNRINTTNPSTRCMFDGRAGQKIGPVSADVRIFDKQS